ncbi:MAG: hypothetical protein DRQ47_09410 [Gammaproteobacteria bacterium]|nr:MAG: hypothetical protein DRQ47_09410 [Gammaproteobacteria bacterium]
MFYKQKLNNGSFRVVETLKWTNKQVMLEDVKSGLVYVITWDSFFPYHEELTYECYTSKYCGADLSRPLKEI